AGPRGGQGHHGRGQGRPGGGAVVRPRHRPQRRRGHVLRGEDHAALWPGGAGPAHRRPDPARGRVRPGPGPPGPGPAAGADRPAGHLPRGRGPRHPGRGLPTGGADQPRSRPVAPPPTQLAQRLRRGPGPALALGAVGYPRPVRVGLVCPYSLTVPGGVQAQVLGLARVLRLLGFDARVLPPADRPPPDAGVTPLGKSVPTASNGSFAPLAPDPAAQLRTIRALRDEAFDVVHVHEPLAPGPTMTTLLFRNAPLVGTFHRAGDSAAYALAKPGVRWLAKRLDLRCAVSKDALHTARKAVGGDYELLFNGIEVERFAKAAPEPTDGPTILFVGRHEDRKGLAVLLDALRRLPADVRVWGGGPGPQTEALRSRHGGDPRVTWLGRLS